MTPATPHGQSFCDLAATRTLPVFDTVTSNLRHLTAEVTPHDPELKALRKQVQRLRDHLDIFAFAWKDLRTLRVAVDDGYEVLGRFKDLFDRQRAELEKTATPTYDDRELERLRCALLKWSVRFNRPAKLGVWRARIATPTPRIADLDRRQLTKFFWGGVPFRPQPTDSGLTTIARLGGALAKNAAHAVKKTAGVSLLTRLKHEEAFHDTRKRLRTTANLFKNFSDVRAPPRSLAVVTEAVSRYGALEDRLVAWHVAKTGDRTKRLERELKTAWKKVRAWQARKDLVGALKTLAT